jgi:hypothetical protein
VDHLCQAKLSQFLGQIQSKVWKRQYSQSEPKLKLKQFAAITPHLLLMDHSMALVVCDQ